MPRTGCQKWPDPAPGLDALDPPVSRVDTKGVESMPSETPASSPLAALTARYHRAFNERDFDAWREVFHEDVGARRRRHDVHGRGRRASRTAPAASHSSRASTSVRERIVAEHGDVVVAEIDMVHGDPAGGVSRRQGTVCEICVVRDGRIASVRSYYMAEPSDERRPCACRRAPRRRCWPRSRRRCAGSRRWWRAGAPRSELFDTVTREIGWLVGRRPVLADALRVRRHAHARRGVERAQADFVIGTTHPVDDELHVLRETGRPLRWGPSELPAGGPFVEEARSLGVRTAVGVPIVVDGDVWGVAFASSAAERPLRGRRRDADRRLHRAGRDRDRERPGARATPGAGGRAGRARARRDARRPRRRLRMTCSRPWRPRSGRCWAWTWRTWSATSATTRLSRGRDLVGRGRAPGRQRDLAARGRER